MNDPRRHLWSRTGLGGSLDWPSSTSRSVGEALADDPYHGQIGAGLVVDAKPDPIAVAKVEFGQIPMEVGFAHVLINAVDAALDDGEVAFDGVGVIVVAHVFLGRMVHDTMVGIEGTGHAIDWRLIALETAIGVSVLGDDRPQIGGGHVWHVEATDAAVPLNQRENSLLDAGRFVSAAGGLPADKGFIRFNGHTGTAHRFEMQNLHRFADAVRQEPSGFEGNAQGPMKLLSADPLFAGAKQVHRLQPYMKRDMAGLHDSANGRGKWLAASVALAHTKLGGLAVQTPDPVLLSATRADRTIGPDARFNERQCYGLIVKVSGGQNRLSHGKPPMAASYLATLGQSSITSPFNCFLTKKEATACKRDLQSRGFIAEVIPAFAKPAESKKKPLSSGQ